MQQTLSRFDVVVRPGAVRRSGTKNRTTLFLSLSVSLSLAGWISLGSVASASPVEASPEDKPTPEEATQLLHNSRPLSFIENRGQWDTPAKFILTRGSTMARFESKSIFLQLDGPETAEETVRTCGVRMNFDDCAEVARIEGESKQETYYNYFLGADPKNWHDHVPGFDSIVYRDLYPGIDLRAHGDRGLLEYDFILAPGAKTDRVRIRCEGLLGLSIRDGALVLETEIGTLEQLPPISWLEKTDGSRDPVASRFVLHDDFTFGFSVPEWSGTETLVIDPQIDWSTFLGNGKSEFARAVAINEYRSIVVAGETSSLDFITTPGAVDRHPGGKSEAYVTVLNSRGSHIRFSTYIGGSAAEIVSDLYLDEENGGVLLVGETVSPDFPTTDLALDRTRDGDLDGFVAKLSATGAVLVYSTYVGGAGEDRVRAITLNEAREVIIAGETTSSDFPTTEDAYQTTNRGDRDVFVMSIKASGARAGDVVFSTYVGGTREDIASSLAYSPEDGITIAGMSFSRDFPTTDNALRTEYGGKGDGFLTRLAPDGQSLDYSTFIGGEGNDGVAAIAFSPTNNLVATGFTWSREFPITENSFQSERAGGLEVFVACLNLTGNGSDDVVWSTYLGGNKLEYSYDVAIDDHGGVTLIGQTVSNNFPSTPDAFASAPLGQRGSDAFLVRLNSSGSELLYGTYFGANNIDTASALCLDGPDGVVIVGETISHRDFPITIGSHDPTFSGGWDVFISHLTIPATQP